MITKLLAVCCVALALATLPARAQTPPPYGAPITLEQARKVVAAAEAEARRNGWSVVIAVVDGAGHLVLLQRQDNTQVGSVEVARGKAWTSAAFRRPTKAFEDMVAGGGAGLKVLTLQGVVAAEGGLPIVLDGKLIGAIGVSGMTSQQDGQIAAAGAAVLK
jgi:glc operon protein GlcG